MGVQVLRKNLSDIVPQMVRFSRQLLTEAEGDFLEPLKLLDLCLTKVTKYGNLVTKYGNFEREGNIGKS